MTEKKMYADLKKRFGKYLDFSRIETGALSIGVPDVFFITGNNKSGWIELKVISGLFPVKVPYRPGQLEKMKRMKSGGCSIFLLFYKNGMYFVTKTLQKTIGLDDILWSSTIFNENLLQILIGDSNELSRFI